LKKQKDYLKESWDATEYVIIGKIDAIVLRNLIIVDVINE